MKVGIDLHGVLDEYPSEMKIILQTLMMLNIDVHIISGPPTTQIEEELRDLGFEEHIHYNFVNSVVDYLKTTMAKMWKDENGDWWADDESWWDSKAGICERYDIDFMIDDSPRYEPAFRLIKCKYIDFQKFIL